LFLSSLLEFGVDLVDRESKDPNTMLLCHHVEGSRTNPSRVATGVKVFLVWFRDREFTVSHHQLVYSFVEAVFSTKVFIECKEIVNLVDLRVVLSEPWFPKENFVFT
jgi:hypothetical protein